LAAKSTRSGKKAGKGCSGFCAYLGLFAAMTLLELLQVLTADR
jgi:hypothetical protein